MEAVAEESPGAGSLPSAGSGGRRCAQQRCLAARSTRTPGWEQGRLQFDHSITQANPPY